jgi:penicillin-binding protein activator
MNKKLSVLFLILFLFTGCGTKVTREDPMNSDEVTEDYDIKDINIIAKRMLDSLHSHRLSYKEPPATIVVFSVKNKTYEHIDTKAITETIVTGLLKSGKFRVIAEREMRVELGEEEEYKSAVEGDGIYSPDQLRKHKSKITADLAMYGEITGIEKQASGVRDVSYKMTLKLVNIETTLTEWQEQKDIRKKATRGFFGW